MRIFHAWRALTRGGGQKVCLPGRIPYCCLGKYFGRGFIRIRGGVNRGRLEYTPQQALFLTSFAGTSSSCAIAAACFSAAAAAAFSFSLLAASDFCSFRSETSADVLFRLASFSSLSRSSSSRLRFFSCLNLSIAIQRKKGGPAVYRLFVYNCCRRGACHVFVNAHFVAKQRPWHSLILRITLAVTRVQANLPSTPPFGYTANHRVHTSPLAIHPGRAHRNVCFGSIQQQHSSGCCS